MLGDALDEIAPAGLNDSDAAMTIARRLIEGDPDSWINRLGSFVCERTVEDVTPAREERAAQWARQLASIFGS